MEDQAGGVSNIYFKYASSVWINGVIKLTVSCDCGKHRELLLSLGEELQLHIPVIVGGPAKRSDLGLHGQGGYASFVARRTEVELRFDPNQS